MGGGDLSFVHNRFALSVWLVQDAAVMEESSREGAGRYRASLGWEAVSDRDWSGWSGVMDSGRSSQYSTLIVLGRTSVLFGRIRFCFHLCGVSSKVRADIVVSAARGGRWRRRGFAAPQRCSPSFLALSLDS